MSLETTPRAACLAVFLCVFAAQVLGRRPPMRVPDIYFAPAPEVLVDAMLNLAKVTALRA
jgi:hypothetical protein